MLICAELRLGPLKPFLRARLRFTLAEAMY